MGPLTDAKLLRVAPEPKPCNDINAYCVIYCEGEKVTGFPVKQTPNPEFNLSAIFYRRSPQKKPIIIDVWHDNMMVDAFIGRLVLRQNEEVEGQVEELVLTEKKDPSMPSNTGSVVVVTYCSRNLQAF